MKRFILPILIASIILLGMGGLALASDISTATYQGIITVTNNSTAATNVATVMTLSSSDMISQGWVDSAWTRIAIRDNSGADIPFMPAWSTNPWALWVTSINANTSVNYNLYTGPSDMSATKYYFPGTGGMSVSDNANLEPAGNFSFSWSGYFDTTAGASKNLVSKTNALNVYVSPTVSSNITADIVDPTNIYPTISSTSNGTQGSASSISVTLPSGFTTGDLILVFITTSDSVDYRDVNTPTNWTSLYAGSQGDGSGGRWGEGFYRIISGDSSPVTFTFSATADEGSSYVAYRIATGSYEGVPAVGVTATGSATNPNPPTLTSGFGAVATTYFATAHSASTQASYPTNYNNNTVSNGGTGYYTYSGTRNLTAVSDDPGTFGTSTTWVSNTIAINGYGIAASVSATGVSSGEHDIDVQQISYLSYDGNDYLTNSISNFRSADSVGAVEIWFRPNSAHTGTLFDSSDTGTATSHFWLYTETNNAVYFQTRNAGGTIHRMMTTQTYTAGAWNYIIIQDTGSAWQSSMNGSVLATMTNSSGGYGDWFDDITLRDNINIGALVRTGISTYFNGRIGFVRVYSRTMTNPEIQTNYLLGRGGASSNTTGLVYNLPLSEGTGNPVDTVGSLTMTLTGATWQQDLSISVDGSSTSTTATSPVPNNANNYTFVQNNVMPYVQTISTNVSGVQRGAWQWNYGATFPDDSGNGNTATPTFRSASSDADVSAALVLYSPISTAIAPAYAVSSANPLITGNVTMSSNFTSGAVGGSTGLPGKAVIDAAAAASNTPNIWIWGILGGLTIAMIGLFISYMERRFGGGAGTIFLRLAVASIVFGVLIAFEIFDFWMLFLYLIIALAPAIASRFQDFGAQLNELHLIGFLSMAWLGLTGINRVMEGQMMQSAETAHLNTLMFTQQITVAGLWSLPVINTDFFTNGLPALLDWEKYTFFTGNAQMIQYLLYSINSIVSFVMLTLIIGFLASNLIRARG